MKTTPQPNLFAALLLGAVIFTASQTPLASQTFGEKAAATADAVKEKVQDTGKTAVDKLDRLWQQIDSQRLKHRTRDELVGWLIMGVVVGSILGGATKLAPRSAFALGLIGAFLGGVVVHLTEFEMGLGPILIRYEDLLCSLIGAVVVLLIARRALAIKQPKK